MKTLKLFLITGLIISSQAFASYEVIGETKECEIHTKVIKRTDAHKKQLLIIHDREVTQLDLIKRISGIEYYSSANYGDGQLGSMTYEAEIMGPEMSRLSQLSIYLSGRTFNCFIEK